MVNVCVLNQGCSANLAESEQIKGMVGREYVLVDDPEFADVVIINACTVKGITTPMKEVRRQLGADKKIILTGCVSRDLLKQVKTNEEISVVTTHNIDKVNPAIEKLTEGKTTHDYSHRELVKVGFPRVRTNKLVGIIPISEGCSKSCTYCSTVIVKGQLYSYPVQGIVEEAKKAVAEGCKELWITSQDNALYATDRYQKGKLPELIKELCAIEGDFMLRIGMMNPIHLPEILDETIEAFQHEKVLKFLHLPLQAGSNRVLEKMHREYDVETYFHVLDTFKKQIKDLTIMTDIIVGFPSETDEEFQQTVQAMHRMQPAATNISRFRARRYTAAYQMEDQIIEREKKARSRIITELSEQYAKKDNQKWIGWTGNVLIDEEGKAGTDTFIARNSSYKQFVLPKKDLKIGDVVRVRAVSAETYYILAEVVSKEDKWIAS